jgi:hypothetical protein
MANRLSATAIDDMKFHPDPLRCAFACLYEDAGLLVDGKLDVAELSRSLTNIARYLEAYNV